MKKVDTINLQNIEYAKFLLIDVSRINNFNSIFEDGFPKFELFGENLSVEISFNFEFIIKTYKSLSIQNSLL